LRILYELGNTTRIGVCFEGLAGVAAIQGRADRADQLGREAEALRREDEAAITLDEAVKYALYAVD
jgi:hypothetical protein